MSKLKEGDILLSVRSFKCIKGRINKDRINPFTILKIENIYEDRYEISTYEDWYYVDKKVLETCCLKIKTEEI